MHVTPLRSGHLLNFSDDSFTSNKIENYSVEIGGVSRHTQPEDTMNSQDAMVIQGEHGPIPKKVFRTVQFPRRIDVGKADVKYENGCLVLTA